MTRKRTRKENLSEFAALVAAGLAGYAGARASGAVVSMRNERARQISGASSTPIAAIVQPAAPTSGAVEVVEAELIEDQPRARKKARARSR